MILSSQHTKQAHVFLSHSHKNREDAVYFQNILQKNGATTFLDQDELEIGDILPSRIQEGITRCTAFLLLWSRHAANSYWVEQEWNYAYEKRKKIIPYLLDTFPLPEVLEDRLFIEKEDRNRGHGNLLQSVLGKEFVPLDRSSIFPGDWIMTGNFQDMVGMSCNMQLRTNGQVLGEGKIKLAPIFQKMAEGFGSGMTAFLDSPVNIRGSWSYDDEDQVLTLNVVRSMGGNRDEGTIINIMTADQGGDTLVGADQEGRSWTLKRQS